MTTLFSPVGTADPITRLGDGPMLHIVRHCRPDKVVLYLSQKMKAYQEEDGRFTNAILRLCTAEGRTVPEIELREDPEEQVFRFDHFIDEYEKILTELCAESPDEPVLLNVSSGTPAMEQALVAIGSFGHLRLRMLQVPTPRNDTNKRGDREKPDTYDLDFMWEFNEELRNDDPSACESRIVEVETPNFSARLIRENVKSLVTMYDYEGALELAAKSTVVDDAAWEAICAARDRLNLSQDLPSRVFARSPLAIHANDGKLEEHLAIMEVRLAQGHWADFMRMLTPAFTQLAILTLRDSGLPESKYLRHNGKGRPMLEYDWDVIEKDERLKRVLSSDYNKGSRFVMNGALMTLANQYCEDGETRRKLRELKRAEDKCRHPLAHNLQPSSKETLEKLAGVSLEHILELLFDLHGKGRRHLYEDINKFIIERL